MNLTFWSSADEEELTFMGLKSFIGAAVISLTFTMAEADIVLTCDWDKDGYKRSEIITITEKGIESYEGMAFNPWGSTPRERYSNTWGSHFAKETGTEWTWGEEVENIGVNHWRSKRTIDRVTGEIETINEVIVADPESSKTPGTYIWKGSCELINRKF